MYSDLSEAYNYGNKLYNFFPSGQKVCLWLGRVLNIKPFLTTKSRVN